MFPRNLNIMKKTMTSQNVTVEFFVKSLSPSLFSPHGLTQFKSTNNIMLEDSTYTYYEKSIQCSCYDMFWQD